MSKLSQSEVESYWRDGFLMPIRVFSEAEAQEWRNRFDDLESKHSHDPRLRHDYSVYCRDNFHVVSTAAAELAAHPSICNAVTQILGPDLLVWMVELIVKGPHANKVITMHQDLTYWGLTQPDKLVSAWVALSDVNIENGAMRFVRGSHTNGAVTHEDTFAEDNLLTRGQRVMAEWEPEDEVVDALSAGEMSLHHGLMFHGSGPNTTDQPRVGIVIRFVSPEVSQTVAASDFVLPVRGKNRTKNLTSITSPDSDFSDQALDLYDVIFAASSQALAAGANEEISYLR